MPTTIPMPRARSPIRQVLSTASAYNILMYNIGVDYVIGNSPVFIEAGWTGTGGTNKSNAPSQLLTANGPFVGLGIKF